MWAWSQNDKEIDDPTLRDPVSVCLWYLLLGLEVGEQLAKNVLVKGGIANGLIGSAIHSRNLIILHT